MKKTTILMALAAFALFSCSKNQSSNDLSIANDPSKINFNSSTGLTRAAANGLTEVQGGFNVLGFKHSTVADSAAFIDGKEATSLYKYTNPAWAWDNLLGKEWPTVLAEYPLTFYAEYPKVDLSLNANLTKDIALDLVMANQVDYLVAKSHVITRPATGFAPLAFKHILSNLAFKVKTSKGYTVHIQSIRVVNTAKSGRTFDYAKMAYGAETAYTGKLASTDGTYKSSEGFFFNENIAGDTPYFFATDNTVGGAAEQVAAVDPETANEIMMQMPQLAIDYWTKANTANGLGKFETDAQAWKADVTHTTDSWYDATVGATPAGMKGSKGWEGSRIEVIYRIVDKDGKSVIGRKSGEKYIDATGAEATATKDYFVRVGFPLDLAAITAGTPAVAAGWEMAKRYTYTISLGTVDATNGILLDPDYKDNAGASDMPKIPVENPKTDPGAPVTPAGLINFDVAVDNWVEGDIAIK